MKHLDEDATDEEVQEYLDFWRVRGRKVTKIMGWVGLSGFDPDFSFVRKSDALSYSQVTLPLDVVDKLIELDERIATEPSTSEGK